MLLLNNIWDACPRHHLFVYLQRMENRVVLITGASSGIGLALGEYLQSKKFIVYGTTRDPDQHKAFETFKLLKLDVRDSNNISDVVREILTLEGRLDILINNAGMGITGPVEETPQEQVLKVFETNFHGPVNMIKEVLPLMRRQKSGLIINITSIAAYMGLPYRAYYSASKGALELLTEAVRMETRDFGIALTNLAPGDIATNIASGRYHVPPHQQSPYNEAYEKTLHIMNEHVSTGLDPVRVAKKVYEIINTKHPKIHYKVGSPLQKFSLVLKNLLPDKVYERLLLNHYKL